MVEHLLTTSEYLEPKSIKGADAYGTLLFRLLILQPGSNPLHPGMGVGLGPKYRFISEDDLEMLRTRIQKQIETYMPGEFLACDVILNLKENTKYLNIIIIADGIKFIYDTENSSTPIELNDLVS